MIRSNYGDDSIALVQWVFEAGLSALAQDIRVVYIETGWEAEAWHHRIELGEAHAKSCGFKVEKIQAQIPFNEAVKGRNSFPSSKFQWCSGLIKGLPFLDWLDGLDLRAQAIIAIAKRKAALPSKHPASIQMIPWVESCEFHQGRSVWHPLIDVSEVDRDALISRAGFLPLGHRSLECDPCVNSTLYDLSKLNQSRADIKKIEALEEELGQSFFSKRIQEVLKISLRWISRKSKPANSKDYLAKFYRGCGNHFGCGL